MLWECVRGVIRGCGRCAGCGRVLLGDGECRDAWECVRIWREFGN